jgi:hypothetical protein
MTANVVFSFDIEKVVPQYLNYCVFQKCLFCLLNASNIGYLDIFLDCYMFLSILDKQNG